MTDIQGTLYTGYDEHDDRSYLLTVWPDGILEVATRPGRDDTRIRWSPPVRLTREPLS
jgi:hypothetical protein